MTKEGKLERSINIFDLGSISRQQFSRSDQHSSITKLANPSSIPILFNCNVDERHDEYGI